MERFFTPRWLLTAYAFAGLIVGSGFSVWRFGNEYANYYRHTDGSLTTWMETLDLALPVDVPPDRVELSPSPSCFFNHDFGTGAVAPYPRVQFIFH